MPCMMDTDHIHGHIVFNSVRCVEQGLKYDYRNGDWDNIIQPLVNKKSVKSTIWLPRYGQGSREQEA